MTSRPEWKGKWGEREELRVGLSSIGQGLQFLVGGGEDCLERTARANGNLDTPDTDEYPCPQLK